MINRICRPPIGTENATYHWLHCEDNPDMIALWLGGAWFLHGVEGRMSQEEAFVMVGLTYWGPCEKPKERADG